MFNFQIKRLEKITQVANETIGEALGCMKNPYIAWSTGKDSTVVLHLVLKQCPSVTAVYFDADCAFPETSEMLDILPEKWGFRLIRQKTEPFLDTIKRLGLFNTRLEKETMKTTVYEPIRQILKEHQFDGCFLGLRAGESAGRAKLLQSRKKIFFNQRDNVWQCIPLGWWNTEDVWNYIELNNLDYNKVYDKPFFEDKNEIRVSYWAGETNRRKGRFVRLKYFYPELFNKLASICPEARNFV